MPARRVLGVRSMFHEFKPRLYRSYLARTKGRIASTLMPRVHRIAGLLKRWLLGTHQDAVAPPHLTYYVDEFTFRSNCRKSNSPRQAIFPAHATAASTSRRLQIRTAGDTTGWGLVS
jgi:hypothetical protein